MIESFSSAEIAVTLAAVANGAPLCQFLPAQGLLTPVTNLEGKRFGLTRLKFELTTAVATRLGLVVPATGGTPLVSDVGFNVTSVQAGGAGVNLLAGGSGIEGRLVSTWTVAPTFDATPIYFLLGMAPATVGAFIEWTWPEEDPLVIPSLIQGLIPAQPGIVVQNITGGASAALLVSARWKEF